MLTGKFSPRRLFRLHWNRKHKQRDRYKPDEAKKTMDEYPKYHRYRLWARQNMRAATHTDTGYGAAFEYCREDKDLFGHP